MSRKIHVSLDDKFVEPIYGSKLKQAFDLISPTNAGLILGRGATKTTTFMAQRAMDVSYDMEGCYQALVADTYVNAMRNVVPTFLDGWNKAGWREGIHYVTDVRPPKKFKLPYKPPLNFKHTISLFNGCFFNLGSLDQPGGLAGNSYQHLYGDESRLLKFDKLKRITPALRGEISRFGHSVFYGGRTFTTDMPNILSGDEDWIWDMQKEMDQERAELALQVGLVVNEITCEIINYSKAGDTAKVQRLERQRKQWVERWVRARKGLTFFYVGSSYFNADILSENFFINNLAALGPEEFKSAVLSLKIDIKKGEKFYGHLGEHHYYDDGVNNSYYDKYLITEDIEESSLALRYIDHNSKLEIGVDFGDMMSLVSAQHRGHYFYCLKDFHTLAPESIIDLARKFREFYKYHKYKVVDMYYDRSGNQYAKLGRDMASELKRCIEYEGGASTGWTVNLMNLNQSNIEQQEEYNFARALMGEAHPELPKLKIDKFQCKHLKSSLELTKIKVKVDKKGRKQIYKDKSSEKLPLQSRPMFSTNFSDAFKYLVCRPSFLRFTSTSGQYSGLAPSVH